MKRSLLKKYGRVLMCSVWRSDLCTSISRAISQVIYVIELTWGPHWEDIGRVPFFAFCWVHKRLRKELDQYFPKLQASSIKDFLLWFITNLRTAKHISISKQALQRRKKGTNDFHNVISAEVSATIISKESKTRFLLHTKLSSLLNFFQNTI